MVLEIRYIAILYKCNVWHTQESRELLAVCHNVNTCIGLANKKAITEGNVLDKECIYQLESMLQTQSYNGDGEFIIVKEPLNKLL